MEKLKKNNNLSVIPTVNSQIRPVVIAHRGASGYVPEHTLAAKALAYAMGADYLEQDIVASRDDALVVLHDIHLDRVTNVTQAFPHRARSDGRFYVRDFDLDELRSLSVWERMNADGSPVYPKRFPPKSGSFRIHTLSEELELVAALNTSTGKKTGVYPEIKRPEWHKQEGVDIAPRMLNELTTFGYLGREDPVYVQCFDADELVRLRNDLGCELRLVQLIGENSWGESGSDYDLMRTPRGLKTLAATVDGIGPWVEHLYELDSTGPRSSGFVEAAQGEGLAVHPFTFRRDSLPSGFESFDALLTFVIGELGADGLFTDFPDLVRRIIDAQLESDYV